MPQVGCLNQKSLEYFPSLESSHFLKIGKTAKRDLHPHALHPLLTVQPVFLPLFQKGAIERNYHPEFSSQHEADNI